MWEHARQTGSKLACQIALVVLSMVMLTNGIWAQSQASTGQISGHITDSTGAAVAGAEVKATNDGTGLTQTVTTNQDGIFRIVLLPTGTYTVTVTASGFAGATANKAQVLVGRTLEVNLTLSAGGQSEVVEVSAGAVAVQTTRSEADAVQNEVAINTLPINGRRFQDFVTLTPAAQVDPQRGQISLSGQRGINGNVNIDGLDYNQGFFGGIRGGERSNNAFTVPQESIKEFQVVAAGYSAEFGRSTGGLVNAVTKSGSNELHGSAFYLNRNKSLSKSNAFFDQVSRNLRRQVVPAPTQQQFGGSIGGPIKKNKAFFFFAYEQQKLENERATVFNGIANLTPAPTSVEAFNFYTGQQGVFKTTNDAISLTGRFDYEINPTNRFNIRYSFSDNEAINANSAGNAIFPTTVSALSNNGTEKDRTNTLVGQYTSFFTNSMVNEMRAQYSRERRPRGSNSALPTVNNAIGNFGAVNFLPNEQFDWRAQVADNITWTKGNHTIKFGGEFNHVYAEQLFGFNQFGNFSFRTTDVPMLLDILSVGGAVANRFDSTLVNYDRQIGNRQLKFASNEIALFAQDAWRVKPKLTINYGLRWEGQFNPEPEANNAALINKVRNFKFPVGVSFDPTRIEDAAKQFAPRLGLAFAPDSKSVIRAFSGIYYARTPLLLFASPANNFRTPPGDVSVRLPIIVSGNPNNTVYKQLKLIGIDLNTSPLGSLPVITAEQVQSIAGRLGVTLDPFNGASVIGTAPGFRNPRSYQAGAGYERELAPGLIVGVDYSYIQTVKLQRNHELNLPTPVIDPADPARRPRYLTTGRTRPIPTLGSIQVRESSARALFQSLTVRMKMQRKWGQLSAFYTYSQNKSDDDNERSAGGADYEDPFNFKPEYGNARLDARHQFTANPVFFLPYGIELSSAIRVRSGRPIDASFGSDVNATQGGPDRPYSAPGVPFVRNGFRNRAAYNIDLRVQKGFTFRDKYKVTFSAEFFNIFNLKNIELAGAQVTNYCISTTDPRCGFSTPTNPNFLQIIDQNPATSNFGRFLTNNNPGSPFQAQLGARFNF